MNKPTTLVSWVESNLAAQITFLEKIVGINSHTKNVAGVNEVQDVFRGELLSIGLDVDVVPIADSGNLLVARTKAAGKGSDAPVVLLSGHVDTVHPPTSTFTTLRQIDDMLIGPGSLDMKGGLAIMLWALKALHQIGVLDRIPLCVILNPEEEVGSPRARLVLQELAKNASSALVFEWGRDNNSLITKRKGIGGVTLRARGVKAHSGNSLADGRNAIEALCHAVIAVQKLTNFEAGTTVSVNMISGGTSPSTVPDEAQARCDFRSPSVTGLVQIIESIKAIASIVRVPGTSLEVEVGAGMDPLEETEGSLHLFESFRGVASGIGFRFSKMESVLGGASDANILAGCGVPTIDGLGPLGTGAHTDSEYSLLSSYVGRTASLAAWLHGRLEA